MRVWDVSAGYLNRQSLLGEHRELHGLHNILAEGRKGYSRHPETLRWVGAIDGLCWRHVHEVAEMTLRGYVDRSPLPPGCAGATWPATFVDEPADQFRLLRAKYVGIAKGRIPLPRTPQQLWAQHQYSVLARDPAAHRQIDRAVGRMAPRDPMADLARTLVLILRQPPPGVGLDIALQQMWRHVSALAGLDDKALIETGPAAFLERIQVLAVASRNRVLLTSTAMSELAVYA